MSSEESLWYKDAVIYQLHVRAFYDSDGDGIGDFRGLAEKLDYLQDLGVTAVWLLPFYPSPLKDDGYDIASYNDVHPSYGTLADFRLFLREAHRRGLRVITELVVNHTSDQHPWFQRARRSPPGSNWRNYYVWSDTPERYKETRIIFQDFEHSNWAWDPIAKAYYWHRFYSHQPDLNYENPEVHKAILQALDFWLGMGVDGVRLDAVPYLYEREGTNCENLPETHEFLKKLRRHVDNRYPNRMVLAEANQWPEDAVAYFGSGDECHTAFHFPLMPRMFMSLQMEDRYPIIDILSQTPEIPPTCQWFVFLRNHDELTLEMVTDEERDYMYRVYATDPQMRINVGIRRRLAPLLGNDRRKIELMNCLLMSMPGTPILYYGDEIGMGDNIYLGDRNGVRTPMQWSADRNAGFSRSNPQRLFLPVIIDPEHHYEVVNVEARRNNPHSLLWWTKRLVAVRRQFKTFGRGAIEFLYPDNSKVLVFVRRHESECILVVANLSRLAQPVTIDLARFAGLVPTELFGNIEFPVIGEQPYTLTLSPYAFYWFSLKPQTVARDVEVTAPQIATPVLTAAGSWESLFREENRQPLNRLLPDYLRRFRWFGGKANHIRSAEITEAIPVPHGDETAYLVLVAVEYTDADAETYVLFVNHADGERAQSVLRDFPHDVLAHVEARGGRGVLYGGLRDAPAATALLQMIGRRRRSKGTRGEMVGTPTRVFRETSGDGAGLDPSLMRAEQSNSSVQYGDRFILKLFRRVEAGLNPDLELGLFLSERAQFPHIPPVAGFLQHLLPKGQLLTLAVLHRYVPNQGDAWSYTCDSIGRYFEQALAAREETRTALHSEQTVLALSDQEFPAMVGHMIGPYLEPARLLGQRTAEMHISLASERDDPAFAPEEFTTHYQRSIYQSMRNEAGKAVQLLRRRLGALPENDRELARRVVDSETEILRRFRHVLGRRIATVRTRLHGDYHLGQVLWTGRDFVIIDFEGEPSRPISERRIKRSPLRDVAGMIRSFHYAASIGLRQQVDRGMVRPEQIPDMEDWARSWWLWVSAKFLKEYRVTAAGQVFLPSEREVLEALLNAYILEKAAYELRYELNHRPDWVRVPMQGILQTLQGTQ